MGTPWERWERYGEAGIPIGMWGTPWERYGEAGNPPERRLVMVEGSWRCAGLCVVTPISMEPAHLSTILSMRTWKSSLSRSARALSTTPWLKSSVALGGDTTGGGDTVWGCTGMP